MNRKGVISLKGQRHIENKTNADSFVVTPTKVLPFTLFSQSPESVQGRTLARGNRKFPPRQRGCGGHPPRKARARAKLRAVFSLSGKAREKRGSEQYIKYVSDRATTRNVAWRRKGKRKRTFAYQPQVTRRRKPPPMPFAYHCHLRLPFARIIPDTRLRARFARANQFMALPGRFFRRHAVLRDIIML